MEQFSRMSVAIGLPLTHVNGDVPARQRSKVKPTPPRMRVFLYPYQILINEALLFNSFLHAIADKADNPQSLYWPVMDLGIARVKKFTILVMQVNREVECLGRVERLLAADNSEALLEVRVMAWNTPWGFKTPDGLLSAFAGVSRERLSQSYDDEAQLRMLNHNVLCHTFTAFENVHKYLGHRSLECVPKDIITSAVMGAFLENEVTYLSWLRP